jgi:prepilin-type N-terminal cleavage/methylation domain-containing protein
MKVGQERGPAAVGHRRTAAFTLIEVVVASAILAVGLAGILMICSGGLRTARVLDRVHVDAGSLAAMLSLTNKLEEGVTSGNFGDLYPGYNWVQEIREIATNGLFQVDYTVYSAGDAKGTESRMSILLHRPQSTRRVGR